MAVLVAEAVVVAVRVAVVVSAVAVAVAVVVVAPAAAVSAAVVATDRSADCKPQARRCRASASGLLFILSAADEDRGG